MVTQITKRDGRKVPFEKEKIANAILKAASASGGENYQISMSLAEKVTEYIEARYEDTAPSIEEIQDAVEKILIETGHARTAKEYILYRAERTRIREMNTRLMKVYEDLTFQDAEDSDLKRENANIDGNTAMGTMLKYGSEGAKQFYEMFVLKPDHARAHKEGDIHIHDMDFLSLTTTCCQIDIQALFEGGFSTGHGYLREPNDINSYSALACIAIQSNQNDQHGGQSIPNFDFGMAPGVAKTYSRLYRQNFLKAVELLYEEKPTDAVSSKLEYSLENDREFQQKSYTLEKAKRNQQNNGTDLTTASPADTTNVPRAAGVAGHYLAEEPGEQEFEVVRSTIIMCFDSLSSEGLVPSLSSEGEYEDRERDKLADIVGERVYRKARLFALRKALQETERSTYQAMEAFVHNLNTMHSRAGAQIPFSSINYGTCTTPEGRMVIKNVLLATEAGLGNGETAIFPIHIFRVKEGINYNPEDENYDLFKLACKVSAKRLFPNFAFQDAPFNLKYWKKGRPETEIAYMGCRTRVIGNINDVDREITFGRGNLSFTTINLPRIALRSSGSIALFFEELDRKIDLVIAQLLERFEIQAKKRVKNFPFLMGQGVWIDSGKLGWNDEIREVIKHGTLTMGFIGLAEALKALTGRHHGESAAAQNLGLEIIGCMRQRMDDAAAAHKLNFSLLATPAEGTAGRFVKLDRVIFGNIPGVTDRDYYTNSFHIPVYFPIGAYDKIQAEAPYHALTNAGHISYIELDGDPTRNLEAFEKIVRAMKEAGIGYGSINHPVDRDPLCGYSGIIGNTCPSCGRDEGDIPFVRIRRITGYLVGSLENFNNAKRAEERERLKHVEFR